MTNRVARCWILLFLILSLCLPLLTGSTDQAETGAVAGAAGPITVDPSQPVLTLGQYEQYRREQMSPTYLPGATGSAAHPGPYGPKRSDSTQGTPPRLMMPDDES